MAASFPTSPTVGAKIPASWGGVVSIDAVLADSGQITITPSAANTPTSGSVTFSKTFPSAPNVQVTANTSVPGTGVTGVSVTGISTTGCTVWVTAVNTTARALNWLAVLTQ